MGLYITRVSIIFMGRSLPPPTKIKHLFLIIILHAYWHLFLLICTTQLLIRTQYWMEACIYVQLLWNRQNLGKMEAVVLER